MRKPSAKMCVNRVTVMKQRVKENTATKNDDDGNGDNLTTKLFYWMDMNSHDKDAI